MPLFRFPILFRENGYEAIMRSHAVLRGFRHDLGLDIADNLFSCDYGGSVQIPLHRIIDSASNGSVFPVVTEHFSASSDHAFL